jgi:hypothetical protein
MSEYEQAMDGMDDWRWQTDPRTVRLAQALRTIRDTCPGYASNVARRALEETAVPDPAEDAPECPRPGYVGDDKYGAHR